MMRKPLFRPSRPDFIETDGRLREIRDAASLFRPSRPDFIETKRYTDAGRADDVLFRPSRPDFIETTKNVNTSTSSSWNCSGLLGRTSLRRLKFPLKFPTYASIVPAF